MQPADATATQRRFGGLLMAWAVCALILLTLPACANAQFDSEFRADGTAGHAITILLNRASLGTAAQQQVNERFDAATRQATADGFVAERVDTPEAVGLRVTNVTANASDPAAALNTMVNSLSNNFAATPVAPFSGGFELQSEAVGGSAWTLDLVLDTDVLYGSLTNALTNAGVAIRREEFIAQVSFTYTATLPGAVKVTNGTLVDDSTVRWSVPPSGLARFTATSKPGQQGSTALFVVAAIGSAFAVTMLSGVVGFILLRRRRGGRGRLPVIVQDVADPEPTYVLVDEQPTTFAEVGSTLARVVERVVAGNSIGEPAPPDPQTLDETARADAPATRARDDA